MTVRPLRGLWLLTTLLTACGSSGSTTGPPSGGPPTISLLRVSVPVPIQLDEGETVRFTVETLGPGGADVPGASAHVEVASTDPAVVERVGAQGQLAPASAVEFEFRAVGAGTATIRVGYPCLPGTSGCTPEHMAELPVVVAPSVVALTVDPPGAVTLVEGETTSLEVTAVDGDGNAVPGPDGVIAATTGSPDIVEATVVTGPGGDGAVTVTLDGLDEGVAVVELTHPAVVEPVEILVLVVARVSQVAVEPAELTMSPGDQALVTVRLLDGAGNPVPNAELGVSAVSTEASVMDVVEVVDLDPGDGVIQLRVEASAVGVADLRVGYPGVAEAAVQVTVLNVVPGPDIAAIPGFYARVGTRVDDACGGAPATIGNPPGGVTRATVRGSTVTLAVGSETYDGAYDPATGAWSATLTVQEGSATVRKTHEGNWRVSDGEAVFRGTLTMERLNGDGTVDCATTYAVEYTRA